MQESLRYVFLVLLNPSTALSTLRPPQSLTPRGTTPPQLLGDWHRVPVLSHSKGTGCHSARVANQTDRLPVSAGRRRITSRAEIEQVAFDLFEQQGFEQTTIDDIAAAAGIGRRTFFRYFDSKNDDPVGRLRRRAGPHAATSCRDPPQAPLMDAISEAIVDFNQMPAEQVPAHRRRMTFILGVPALQAHSTLRFAAWRRVIADFVAQRTGQRARCPAAPHDRARDARRRGRRVRAVARQPRR